MKTNIIQVIAVALLATACSSSRQNNGAVSANEAQPRVAADIRGQWYLENIVFSDSEYVRPSEEVPGSRQYILFDDSTYSVRTNCNSISGFYTIKGDSIQLGNGMMTRMACENMATEDALRRILPNIVTVDVENDSIARLNSSVSSEYIVLRKATEKK
ncbi:MAG: META domain-containing protein [Prevotella sp.]|nr:META domain-containing protein [Prevotella sp.]